MVADDLPMLSPVCRCIARLACLVRTRLSTMCAIKCNDLMRKGLVGAKPPTTLHFGLRRVVILLFVVTQVQATRAFKFPFNFRHNHKLGMRVFYQTGESEDDLPECSPWAVCNRVDTYSIPWVERQCRCPGKAPCSMSLDSNDGHTVIDKSRQFKLCEPVTKLPICRYFRDVTWTLISQPDNSTQQIMHCVCPKSSVAYIFKHQAYQTEDGVGYRYLFACSPESRLRCQRKEPCRLFTVRKRPDVEEVNTYTLCQCPHGHTCPQHHIEPSVISGTVYPQEHIRTYSGYCSSELQRK